MKISVKVEIKAPAEKVWEVITDIDGAVNRISGIEKVQVLERPEEGLVGLKWKETRTMFGKSAEETMWITAVEEGRAYSVRAESHGMIYLSHLIIERKGEKCALTMSFGGQAQTLGAKIMGALMGPFFKGATVKALQKDLEDIKAFVEKSYS